MQYRHLHKGINTSDEAATSRENLVNFGAVTVDHQTLSRIELFRHISTSYRLLGLRVMPAVSTV